MFSRLTASLPSILAIVATAASQSPSTPTVADDAPAQPASTVCGDIVNAAGMQKQNSVPFNAAVASRFIDYVNYTLQFQSTLAYLKTPPLGYQQPPVDLIGGLSQIQQDIDSGAYHNQYAFEKDLQQLVYAAHDAHLNLVSGVLAAFSFGNSYDLVCASEDGIEPPKIYIQADVLDGGYTPSALSTINGQDVVEFLSQFAAVQSPGTLEPNTDWNQIFASPAADIQGYVAVWSGAAAFYPGDTVTVKFENGTELPIQWQAIYNDPGLTGPLQTGGDFYNFFVLGQYPASVNGDDSDDDSDSPSDSSDGSSTDSPAPSASPSLVSWEDFDYVGYPQAQLSQKDLATTGGGFLTGYFLNDTSLGVLSIPSFQEFGDAIGTFSDFVRNFLAKAKKVGMKKILIDVQQNGGGDVFLAIDTFKRFFPNKQPFLGSRMRSHPEGDILGETITQYWDSINNDEQDYFDLLPDEFLATPRINADTGQNFSSWEEFTNGPILLGDKFSTTQQYNFSSIDFDIEAFDAYIPYGYSADEASAPQPYAANDVVILSDGICSSACAVFMEMMTSDGKDASGSVRTVAVGGRPYPGPMQAPAGTRGAAMYSADILDSNIAYVNASNTTTSALLPNRTIDTYFTFAGFNLRDQIRQNDSTKTPLQFIYEPADCRIYFTLKNVYNFGQLWRDAANALFNDNSKCVAGSTNQPKPPNPPHVENPNLSKYIVAGVDLSRNFDAGDLFEPTFSGLQDSRISRKSGTLKDCNQKGQCERFDQICIDIATGCPADQSGSSRKCLPKCQRKRGTTNACRGGNCNLTKKTEKDRMGNSHPVGYCPVSGVAKQKSCPGRKGVHRQDSSRLPPVPSGGAGNRRNR
ncbi:MAG: hypothetical protein M1820_006587 [Bogoriella megaspora]|nr:MAG: hypothetical protein M1820_006587 [Bogoriella megaspora]